MNLPLLGAATVYLGRCSALCMLLLHHREKEREEKCWWRMNTVKHLALFIDGPKSASADTISLRLAMAFNDGVVVLKVTVSAHTGTQMKFVHSDKV